MSYPLCKHGRSTEMIPCPQCEQDDRINNLESELADALKRANDAEQELEAFKARQAAPESDPLEAASKPCTNHFSDGTKIFPQRDCCRPDEPTRGAEEPWEDKPIPEDEAIASYHPMETGRHETYAEAMRLVGAKHSKSALVNLVNWLLSERDKFKKIYTEAEAAYDDKKSMVEHLRRECKRLADARQASVAQHQEMKRDGERLEEETEETVAKCIIAIKQEGIASTSFFQRRLRIGYTRASKIMDILEARGIVGPAKSESGALRREVLIDVDDARDGKGAE